MRILCFNRSAALCVGNDDGILFEHAVDGRCLATKLRHNDVTEAKTSQKNKYINEQGDKV